MKFKQQKKIVKQLTNLYCKKIFKHSIPSKEYVKQFPTLRYSTHDNKVAIYFCETLLEDNSESTLVDLLELSEPKLITNQYQNIEKELVAAAFIKDHTRDITKLEFDAFVNNILSESNPEFTEYILDNWYFIFHPKLSFNNNVSTI